MENMDSKWVDAYIPQVVDDLVLNPTSKDKLKRLLQSGKRFNVSLHGRAGIGKTATSNVISKTLDAIEYFVSCSLDGNIDNIRTNVQRFCESVSFDGRPKLVILDEIDGMSLEAQKSLRNIMDNHKDCIFILTCNYLNRVIEPLQSRCPPVSLQFSVSDIRPRVEHILKSESIEYTEEDLNNFMEKILPKFLPDIRTSVSVLQDCCSSGKLDTTTEIALIDGVDETCKYILTSTKEGKTPMEIREYLIKNSEKFSEDYLKLSSSMFNILCRTKIGAEDLSNIADIIYRVDQVIDKEIQFFVLVSYLHNLVNKNNK
tara:strand:+ start:5479 stop:6423 length:945 start_codon:yes stop_codon:yes gene_type:complete